MVEIELSNGTAVQARQSENERVCICVRDFISTNLSVYFVDWTAYCFFVDEIKGN